MKEKFGDCNVYAFCCEGYKGVSQSAGHHIANNQVFRHIVGENDVPKEGKYKINLLGEYNIGGDGFEIDRIFKKCGITCISTFSGNSTYDQFASAHTGRPERGHVPPLDQLRGRHDGDQVRHPLDQGQLHRRQGHRQIACARSPSTSATRN